MREMISGSVSPIFFHSTNPQTVIRVSRIQASPPQTSGVFWIQLLFLRRTSKLIDIARLGGICAPREFYHSFENKTVPTSSGERAWDARLGHRSVFLKAHQCGSK